MFHLTVRVAWHDSKWNGAICQQPSRNCFCVALDRVRESRDDAKEDSIANCKWRKLSQSELPPCKAESGAFMNFEEWKREFTHPYAKIAKTAETHGHLRPTSLKVPPYSTFAVPYAWMLKKEQENIDEKLPQPLPPDEESPFSSAWIFGLERQKAVQNLFFSRLEAEKSLVFFYCKEGQPLGDQFSRLIVGVGKITSITPQKTFDGDPRKPLAIMWDRLLRHSITPDGDDGFLLPYHEYLEPTGDPEEDKRRLDLLREIAVTVDPAHIRTFSYASELAQPDIALSNLVKCLEAVRKIRTHGIVKGPWERREEWLNRQIALTWEDRGAFPGLGSVLEALGMRLGSALALELISSKTIKPDDDPWPIIDSILRGKLNPPQKAYKPDIDAIRNVWIHLQTERLALLKLLSRFALSPVQARRWFEPAKRAECTDENVSVSDTDIINNPYRICETDLGEESDPPVSIGVIDRGLLPDNTISQKHPLPAPSIVHSLNDYRRIRAAIVSVLRSTAFSGDSLLSVDEVLNSITKLDLGHPCNVGSDWVSANIVGLNEVMQQIEVLVDPIKNKSIAALQLNDLKKREDRLRSVLSKRAGKAMPPITENWEKLLIESIRLTGAVFDPKNHRHKEAIKEQAEALKKVTSRRLSVLVGRAGTGKTSVMGALMLCKSIAQHGILLLAPTGKARVRLGRAAAAEAMTIAQFLTRLGRYDSERQRPLFNVGEKHDVEKTIVIDECSMVTMDDLVAIIEAIDHGHVERIILVGDPNQLPPIGVGRPFADLVAFLENTKQKSIDDLPLSDALARLSVEVRTVRTTSEVSDTLRLASWFTREPQPVDADFILDDLEKKRKFNDLDIIFWQNPDELRVKILNAFREHLGLKNESDISGFDTSLGFNKDGMVPFSTPDGSELWQVLSPVRMHYFGVHELNRWIQKQFRGAELREATNPWVTSLGDENIVKKDKVIQVINQNRKAYDGANNKKHYLANGEVGLVATSNNGFLNVLFAGHPNLRFGYSGRDYPGGSGPLELAYALTVHKAQGSEFKKVFVVLPKHSRALSRELIYTALTRSRLQLVLLVEGENSKILREISRPERSETARRNTNIFQGAIRSNADVIPYAEHLIHRTEKGHLVRSKSELVIANMLLQKEIPYEYERFYYGDKEQGCVIPDFTFVTADGDTIIWEHLGMMSREDYRLGWERKCVWYKKNGFVLGKTLFTSEDDENGGLDSIPLTKVALQIKSMIE